MRVPTLALLTLGLVACGGATQRGAAAEHPAETLAVVAATKQPAAVVAAPQQRPPPPHVTPAPRSMAAPPRAATPVPTPGESDYEYRQRIMDADRASASGISVEMLLATRSAISTATRTALGGLQPLPQFPPGTYVSGGLSISFVDERHGWILTGSTERRLLATADGGARWTLVHILDFHASDISFVSSTKGWAAGGFGLYTTDDGGHTWRQVWAAPPYAGMSSSAFVRIDFVDERHGWATRYGAQTRKQELLRSGDGGATWTLATDPCPPTGPVATDSMIGAHHAKGIGPFSATGPASAWLLCWGEPDPSAFPKHLFRTRDGGRSWTLVTEVTAGPVPAGATGAAGATTATATTATPRPAGSPGGLPPREFVSVLFFLDDARGWLAGEGGGVYDTQDGGRTWRQLAWNETPPYISQLVRFSHLHFVSPTHGFTRLDRSGTGLVRTGDGGRTWTLLYPPGPAAFSGVPPCRADDVRVVHTGWLGNTDASASLHLSSAGTSPCVVRGRPTVELLDAAGDPLPAMPAPDSDEQDPVVLVQPDQRALLRIIWRTRCYDKPAGPVRLRLLLLGDDRPLEPDYTGDLELQPTPDALRDRCDASASAPRLDVGPFTPLDPAVTP